jgi:hypothetical protein
MWEVSLRVGQERVVRATPERAWSLVRESAAWSARPGRFAFDLPAQPAGGRFRCVLGPFAASPGLAGSVLEICDEVPGQTISLRHLGVPPMGGGLVTFGVLPHDRGAVIRLMTEGTVLREHKAESKAARRKDLAAWGRVLQDVLEGRRPWPDPVIPASLAQESATRPMLADPQSTSAQVLIDAPLDVVWDAVLTPAGLVPGAVVRPAGPEISSAGRVPGTPAGQAGEMQYVISREAGGLLIAWVGVLRELTRHRSVVTQGCQPPYVELHQLLRPAAGGTLLQLTLRWPDAPVTERGEQARSQVTQALRGRAAACQAAIEQA